MRLDTFHFRGITISHKYSKFSYLRRFKNFLRESLKKGHNQSESLCETLNKMDSARPNAALSILVFQMEVHRDFPD
jgi:hypothetical protein